MPSATIEHPNGAAAPAARVLVTGGDPDQRGGLIPGDEAFEGNPDLGQPDRDFVVARYVERVAAALIARHQGRFRHLRDRKIEYLWRREGGQSKGKATLGRCERPGKLPKYYSEADFIVWLAADNCRAARLDAFQIEALICHELLHAGETEKGKTTIAPHDFEGFIFEIEHYGLWMRDLEPLGRAVQGLQLPLFAAGEVRRDGD